MDEYASSYEYEEYAAAEQAETGVVFGGEVVVYNRDKALLCAGEWLNDTCINLGFRHLELEMLVPLLPPPHTSAGGAGSTAPAAVCFVDPAVLSCLMAQCDDDDEVLDMDKTLRLGARRRVLFAVNDACDSFGAVCTHWSLLLLRIDGGDGGDGGGGGDSGGGAPRQSEAGVPAHAAISFHAYDSCGTANAGTTRAVAAQLTRLLRLAGVLSRSTPDPPLHAEPCPQQRNGSDCGVYALLMAERLALEFLQGGGAGGAATLDAVAVAGAVGAAVADGGGGAAAARSGRARLEGESTAGMAVMAGDDDWAARAKAKREELLALLR